MHLYTLVEIPAEARDIEQAVATALAPYREFGADGEHIETGLWDWYRIGGRWAGLVDGDTTRRGLLGDEHRPALLITIAGGAFVEERWNGASFDDTSAEFEIAWRDLAPDARLVIVDCHT